MRKLRSPKKTVLAELPEAYHKVAEQYLKHREFYRQRAAKARAGQEVDAETRSRWGRTGGARRFIIKVEE